MGVGRCNVMIRAFGWLAAIAAFGWLAAGCVGSIAPREIPPAPTPLPTATPRALEFPADHAPHEAGTEWWYYSGHLRAEDGEMYGFHVALFRTGGIGDGRGTALQRIQASVVDIESGEHWHWTRDGIAGSDPSGDGLLDARVGDASVRVDADGGHWLSATDPVSGVSLDLTLAPSDGVMLHDGTGWLPFPFGSTYYYTYPRMSVTGTVGTTDGPVASVEGEVWYDHQWGDFVVVGWPSGWFWSGLQLADGSSLMFSEVRDNSGSRFRLFGTYLSADGDQRVLDADRDGLALEHLEYWTSEETGGRYPVESRIVVDSLGMEFVLRPAFSDQETVAGIGGNAVASYWEGSVSVVDAVSGEDVGIGYVELAGYAPPAPLSWRSE